MRTESAPTIHRSLKLRHVAVEPRYGLILTIQVLAPLLERFVADSSLLRRFALRCFGRSPLHLTTDTRFKGTMGKTCERNTYIYTLFLHYRLTVGLLCSVKMADQSFEFPNQRFFARKLTDDRPLLSALLYVRTYVQILSNLDFLALAMTVGELQSERTLN